MQVYWKSQSPVRLLGLIQCLVLVAADAPLFFLTNLYVDYRPMSVRTASSTPLESLSETSAVGDRWTSCLSDLPARYIC